MFCLDVETLSKSSEAVILSVAVIHFEAGKKYDYDDLISSAFFTKFDVQDQIKRLHRKTEKSTMEWWSKQCEYVRKRSFVPSDEDVKVEDGYEAMREWVKSFTPEQQKEWVFVRGSLDQLVLDSLEMQMDVKPVFPYSQYRDVRTAIDFLYETKNGYVEVPGFDSKAKVYKHCPINDCAFDIMQLLYGQSE
jgi:hypothetical protein